MAWLTNPISQPCLDISPIWISFISNEVTESKRSLWRHTFLFGVLRARFSLMYSCHISWTQPQVRFLYSCYNITTGLPCFWGNTYRNMTLQAWGVSKIESMNCTQPKTTDRTSHQRKRPTSLNQEPSKNNSGKEEKLVAGLKGVPDTKTDWPTDRRS
jgi:hypothetical protein